MNTIALLTLDQGSILLPTSEPYPEIATINANDGEVIKSRTEETGFGHYRKDLQDIEYWSGGGSQSWAHNIATLADKQAFSIRQNGETILFTNATNNPRTIEMEPLNNGGILIGNKRQLPFGVYLTDATSYRVRKVGDGKVVLEYRQDNHSEWEEINRIIETEMHHLITELADKAGLISLNRPTRKEINTAIEDHFKKAKKTARNSSEEMVANMAAIKTDTSFDNSIPKPAPLFE